MIKFHPIATTLIKANRVLDLFILARYTYRNGAGLMDDANYEKVKNFVKERGWAQEYLNRTDDEDPIPYDLLREFNLQVYIPINNELRRQYYQILNDEKSTSIDSVTDYSAAWDKFQSVRGHDLLISIKADGLYSKKAYVDREFVAGLSRGRAADSWDYTDGLSLVVPRYLSGPNVAPLVRINSEVLMSSEALQYLRHKYDVDAYKTEKSSAISFLRGKIKDPEDYKYLNVMTFSAEGLGSSISESLDRAEELGFTCVPRIKITKSEIPLDFEEFVPWLRDLLDRMFALSMESPIGTAADGVVVEVDSYTYVPEVKHQYSPRNFALKMEHWSFEMYPAIVEKVITSDQGRVWRSCRLAIKPFVTKDKTEARVVNGFNIRILQENGIFPGKRIYFVRNSGAVNILIHGGKLKQIEQGMQDE